MSFYRSMLAAVAAVAIASPVFADDTTTTTTGSTDQTSATSPTTTTTTSTSDASSMSKVNVNTATMKDLMQVKGLSKANAKAIIAYRKAHGNFQNINDLTSNVKGLSKLKSTTLDQLTVE